MKKKIFTFSLALFAISLLGSNVINAQRGDYDYRLPIDHRMTTEITVKANPDYSFVQVVDMPGDGSITYKEMNFAATEITKKDGYLKYDTAYSIFASNERYRLNYLTDIYVGLNFINGTNLIPVVKRSIVVGKLYSEVDANDPTIIVNKMDETDIVITEYFKIDVRYFTPEHTSGNGVALFLYYANIQEIQNKYPIYSISYEISIHDEIGTPGKEAYDPPVGIKPQDSRALTFDIEGNGITTNLPMSIIGNTFYVPSYRDYSFIVTSNESINVLTNRTGSYSDEGVVVKLQAGSTNKYDVTIKRVQTNFNVIITNNKTDSAEGDGTTGNAGPEGNDVWASGGVLYVNAATPGQLSIFTMGGQLYKTINVSGSSTISIPKGMYMVLFNGKSYKVAL